MLGIAGSDAPVLQRSYRGSTVNFRIWFWGTASEIPEERGKALVSDVKLGVLPGFQLLIYADEVLIPSPERQSTYLRDLPSQDLKSHGHTVDGINPALLPRIRNIP